MLRLSIKQPGVRTMSPLRLKQFYNSILCKQDISQFENYFTPDCQIVINDKRFDAAAFKQRMKWIKDNMQKVEVEVISHINSADGQAFSDAHITKVIGNDNKPRTVIVIQHSSLKNEKIHRFIDVTYMLEGSEKDNYIINAK